MDSKAIYEQAMTAMTDRLKDEQPTSREESYEVADEALREWIDVQLIYPDQAIPLWDGITEPEAGMQAYATLRDAVVAAVGEQLYNRLSQYIWDGVTQYEFEKGEET